MPYGRSSSVRRSGNKVSRRTWSVEHTTVHATMGGGAAFPIGAGTQSTCTIVPTTTTEGCRTVKHLTIDFGIDPFVAVGDPYVNFMWAIVYVPEGYNVQAI